MKILSSILSRPGGRDENQDSCGSRSEGGFNCFVLADGLGGHRGGQVAATTAVDAILDRFAAEPGLTAELLRGYLLAGQNAVIEGQAGDPLLSSMRTTAVVLVSGPDAAIWGHVGDSRLYHFRGGAVVAQTEDHSVPQAMVNAGDLQPRQIRGHEDRNRLLRTLGKEDDFRPEILKAAVPVAAGDAFLLCSDGFWEYVTETMMEIEFARAADPDDWLKGMERRLLEKAEPGHDNYSAIAVTTG